MRRSLLVPLSVLHSFRPIPSNSIVNGEQINTAHKARSVVALILRIKTYETNY